MRLGWTIYLFMRTQVLHYAKQGVQLDEKLGYEKESSQTRSVLVLGLTNLGTFKEALDYGLKGIQLAQSLKDTASLSRMYAVIIACYRDQKTTKKPWHMDIRGIH
jgi:ornithine carbamoyltransferase